MGLLFWIILERNIHIGISHIYTAGKPTNVRLNISKYLSSLSLSLCKSRIYFSVVLCCIESLHDISSWPAATVSAHQKICRKDTRRGVNTKESVCLLLQIKRHDVLYCKDNKGRTFPLSSLAFPRSNLLNVTATFVMFTREQMKKSCHIFCPGVRDTNSWKI
jgi:hypothetical protein